MLLNSSYKEKFYKQTETQKKMKMLNEIKDYAKCATRNKFIIGSYLGICTSYALIYLEQKTGIHVQLTPLISYSSAAILGATSFGAETFKAYKRTKKHIKKYRTIDPRFENKLDSYCAEIGLKMAAEDAGLEKIIQKK